MNNRIVPTIIYPIGELPNGQRFCASVSSEGFRYFPEFRAFDLDRFDDPWVMEIPDDAPTLRDEEVQALGSHDEWFWN